MKKIFNMTKTVLLLALFFYASHTHAQRTRKPEQVKLVYTQSTEAGLQELKALTKKDSEQRRQVMARYEALKAEGKIILSSKEYAPIRARINQANNNPSSSEEIERAVYAKNASKTYVVVTDLLK